MTMRPGLAVALALVAALAVQAVVDAQYLGNPFHGAYIADAQSYHEWASRIANHGLDGEAVFHQAPLFPLLLSRAYRLVGEPARPAAGLVLQAVLLALAIAALVPIGRLYLGSTAAGLAAAGLALLHAPFAFYATKLLPTSLSLATQATGIATLGWALRAPAPARAALAGAAWGLACLTRAEMLVFSPFALLALMAWPVDRRRVVSAGAFLAAMVITIAPVSVHNLRRGDAVLIASSSGENLFIGNQLHGSGGHTPLMPLAGDLFSQRREAEAIAERAAGRDLRPSEISSYWKRRAWDGIRQNPAAWLSLELRKLGRLLSPGDPTDLYSLSLERQLYLQSLYAMPAGTWTIFLLAALGATVACRERVRAVWPLVAWIGVQLLVLLAFFVNARLRLPLVFATLPLAGLGAWHLFERARRDRRWTVTAAVAIATTVAVTAITTRPLPRDAVRLASVLSIQQRLDESLAVLRPFLATDSPDGYVLDQAGWVHQKMGDASGAVRHYERAIDSGDLDPNRERQTRTRYAMALELLGRHGRAAEQHDAAVASGHANAGTYYERGMFRLRRGSTVTGIADLRYASRLDPGWPAPRRALDELDELGQPY